MRLGIIRDFQHTFLHHSQSGFFLMHCKANRLHRKLPTLPTVLCKRPRLAFWNLFILFCILFLQCVPGGGGGGTSTQSKRHSRNPPLLPSSHSLPERHAAELPILLHCSVPCRRHPLTTAIHCGGQQDLQRLLERPSAASEKLQHLLPGCQHSQRGGCSDIFSYLLKQFQLD